MAGKNKQDKKPWIPRGAYSKLSKANKVSLWTITISCFVTVFTFWLGLSYQYTIVANKKEESQKAIHYNLVQEVQKYKQAYDNTMLNIVSRSVTAGVNANTDYHNEYMELEMYNNWDTNLEKISHSVDVSEKAKYYLSEDKFRQITFNNAKICQFLFFAYAAKGESQKSESIIRYFLMNNSGDSLFYKELCDSLTIISNRYKEENNLLINDKSQNINLQYYINNKPYGLWIFMETYFHSKSILNTNARTNILKSRYTVFSKICISLAENYRALKSEIEPIKKNETNSTSLSNVFSEPGVYISIMSLIIILPIGFFIWWFFVWLIFRNAEKSDTGEKDFEERKKELEYDLSLLSTISKLYTNQQIIIRELENKVDISCCEKTRKDCTAEVQSQDIDQGEGRNQI